MKHKIQEPNKDIPIETVLKHTLIENGKLKSEIQYLEAELEAKNNAIEAFKKWQTRMKEYKAAYWLTEGIKLAKEEKDIKQLKLAIAFVSMDTRFNSLVKQLEEAYEEVKQKGKDLLDTVESDEEIID